MEASDTSLDVLERVLAVAAAGGFFCFLALRAAAEFDGEEEAPRPAFLFSDVLSTRPLFCALSSLLARRRLIRREESLLLLRVDRLMILEKDDE